MLPESKDYERLVSDFRWNIPDTYNIAYEACDKWALQDPDRVALIHVQDNGAVEQFSYNQLRIASNQLAKSLAEHHVSPGDRVALLLPQSPQAAVGHFAIYKLGAIAVPLASLFGVDALQYRLADSGAKVIITDRLGARKIKAIRTSLPALDLIVCVDEGEEGTTSYSTLFNELDDRFEPVSTGPDTPALMIYTSGTTGPPKGALHGHRVLAGHLPGFQLAHEFFPKSGDRFWTPSDWAWAGGLLNALLPALQFGVAVVARRFDKFDPEQAYRLIADFGIRNIFVPPTALKILKTLENPRNRFDLSLRTIGSAGEALGRETYEWARRELGITINEFYGQTECNFVLSACGAIGISRAGSTGKPVPGHRVAIIDGDGEEVPAGTQGQIAISRPNPVMFLGFWENDRATKSKFIGDWMTTGDQGVMDRDGYVHFVGRNDDVITSAGYRIGPGEIEDCLIKHPAISLAAAVGKPDLVRTEIVKAYVVLKDGIDPSDDLADDIRMFVRTRLSAHEYPREIEFRDSLPMTTTGKIIRRLLRQEACEESEG
ncbi:MAG: acyl-CoA synthetase [Stappiaceae bacterium]